MAELLGSQANRQRDPTSASKGATKDGYGDNHPIGAQRQPDRDP